ncbi:DBH-like monooxygenase protein 1 homolog [Caerostris darwini]|uniref:DBH-like monooxygenase protein 1 homolog n=1 Tax=Caerostris darwini TaxID=1538125 RepID=A0AAV4SQC9_9ARAC|nr:DBH-like monooxygenase protein 1 homolog [Caerostris darwini]
MFKTTTASMTAKKRRLVDENRKYREEREEKHFFVVQNTKLWCLIFHSKNIIVTEEDFHCTTLDSEDNFHVCWKVIELEDGDRDIIFKLEVKTHGYVGFGLSSNGGMAGSDIVTGWVKNGQVYFQDRYGEGNFLPKIDEIQNWNLVSGRENDTHTVLIFRRKLDTCDKEDRKIDDSTTKLIYAYSDEDPETENALVYHFERRGTKSVLLLQMRRSLPQEVDKSTLSHWDVLSPNFSIPSSETTMYWCKIYKAPDLSQKHHVVLMEPLIQEGNERFVHHILLYECVGGVAEVYDPHLDQHGHECHRPNMPDAMKKCEGIFLAWAVGGENLVLPEDVGLPLEPTPAKYYMMEIHYDNPAKVEGIIDQSGLRIYYTPKLRKFDAGTLMIGSTVSRRLIVPPGRKKYVVAGHSNPQCFDPALPKDGIQVLGLLFHAHLLGRHIKARHFRKYEELPPLGEDKNYDFNYQEYRYYQDEVRILPGDQVTVECTYDSRTRNFTTFGGESTREEMCLAFFLYYPRMERFASVSVPQFDVISEALRRNFTKVDMYRGHLEEELLNYNWKMANVDRIEKALRFGLHETHCYFGNGVKNSIKAPVSYPKVHGAYEEISECVYREFQKDLKNGGRKHYFGILMHLYLIFSFYILHIFY